jgi:CheY-like chemotaxis protein
VCTDNDKSPPRIAVIDDEAVVCREIKQDLEKDHYVIETFLQGPPRRRFGFIWKQNLWALLEGLK